MQQFHVHLARQPHEPDGFILDLCDKRLIVSPLRSDQFRDEIFTVRLGHGFTLAVENVC